MVYPKRVIVVMTVFFVFFVGMGLQQRPSTAPVAAQGDAAPEWEDAACGFHVRPDMNVDCGYLTVPQVRGKPEAGTVRVHVAIWRSQNPNPQPDPILFFSVGPGVNTASLMAQYAEDFFAFFLQDRDLIMVDQRGTGYSEPKLDCPAANTFFLEHLGVPAAEFDEELQVEVAEIDATCFDEYLANGADFEGYHTLENAADMRDLTEVLGYEQVNVVGISYGTRLALTVMREYPDIVRSAVLDSVVPIEVNFFEEAALNEVADIELLFAECAADSVCSASFPTLEEDFYALLAQLDESPVHIEVEHPWTLVRYDVVLDGQSFYSFVSSSLGKLSMVPALPIIIDLGVQGDFSLLTEFYKVPMTVPAIVSDGTNFLTWCADDVQFSDEATLTANYERVRPELRPYVQGGTAYFNACGEYDYRPLDPATRAPVMSDIPTLILTGPFGSFAPSHWAEQTAENLSNSRLYSIPGGSDGLLSVDPCADFLAMQHVNDPTGEIDDSCIDEVPAVEFIVYE